LGFTRVAEFVALNREGDHFLFEEVLYRWYLEQLEGMESRGERPHVCLAGGFKTMSAAMQKAAAVLGACEVFHVTCDLPPGEQPDTGGKIDAAVADGRIHWIRLGPEGGWPQLRGIGPADFPLVMEEETRHGPVPTRRVRAPDSGFRERLKRIVERSHRIAGAWGRLPELPFQTLATWPGAALEWLEEKLDPASEADRKWVASLPKAELHCHLGGFASRGELLGEVRRAAEHPAQLPPPDVPPEPEGWPKPGKPLDLKNYMKLGDATGSNLLKDPGCLERHCRLLYEHLRDENILYAEIRCSPANYAARDRETPAEKHRSPWEVLRHIRRVFQDCMDQADPEGGKGPRINLILIATRRQEGDFRAGIARHLALAVTAAENWTAPDQCRVVGVDLAGYEDKETRAHYFREEFTGVHRCGLALTVHAGENDDAEGIWRAVFDLNTRRIGHALRLAQSPDLVRSVAARGIGVEMCPCANYQIHGFQPMHPDGTGNDGMPATHPRYPLLDYLQAGVKVSLNTDNIGISGASLGENFLFAAEMCPDLARMDVLRLLANAIDTAFLSPQERLALKSQFEDLLSPP
jgi:adenosine deaminase